MFVIRKSFDFCYGHRVYSQDVDPRLALSDECPCRRLHGHQGKITVYVSSEDLDNRGFVIDFKELTFLKRFVDDVLDHRFIVSMFDPEFERIVGVSPEDAEFENVFLDIGGESLNSGAMKLTGSKTDDLLDSFVVVAFNPTSEMLSMWISQLVEKVFSKYVDRKFGVFVEWSETPKTGAMYENSHC